MTKNHTIIDFAPNGGGGYLSSRSRFGVLKKFVAFSLAEMMVVMLIMSIVLAAMAPIVTSKAKSGSSANSSPWKWVRGVGPDAYFGVGGVPKAIIGQNNAEGDADFGKLIINVPANGTGSDYSHLLFKRGGANVARLFIGNNNLVLGDSQGNGQYNTAVGISTLSANTGSNNTALGYQAMYENTSGTSNTAVGYQAMNKNESGTGVTAVGSTALKNNTASYNTAVGSATLTLNSDGANNTAIGYAAMNKNTHGNNNTAVGYAAMNHNTEGASSSSTTNGHNNTAMGYASLFTNTTGHENTAIGTNALYKNKLGYYNTAVGYNALYSNVGTNDSYEFGTKNTALGSEALYSNTTGYNNTALGYASLYSNRTGVHNVAIGYNALHNITNGSFNTAVGAGALQNATNTTTYAGNTAVGYSALSDNTTGHDNTAVGENALGSNTAGISNTAIGYHACQYVTGSNKTCIGANSGPTSGHAFATDGEERIFIGSKSKFNGGPAVLEVHNQGGAYKSNWGHNINKSGVVINGNLYVKGLITFNPPNGWAATPGGDEQPMTLYDGDDAEHTIDWAGIFLQGAARGMYNDYFTSTDGQMGWRGDSASYPYSDARLKYLGTENKTGLDKIKQLKVYNFTFKKDSKKTPHVGVIAQDLQKVFPNAVTKGSDGFLRIRMEDMFYAVINAIKELDAKITKLAEQVNSNSKILKQVQNDNKRLIKENQELKARLDKIEAKLK